MAHPSQRVYRADSGWRTHATSQTFQAVYPPGNEGWSRFMTHEPRPSVATTWLHLALLIAVISLLEVGRAATHVLAQSSTSTVGWIWMS